MRKVYKWSPQIVDDIEVNRLLRIFDEMIEDNKERSIDEDDF